MSPIPTPVRPLVLAALGLLAAWPASGDTVVLRNGQQLEGLVREESADRISLFVGMGAVEIDRARIAEIRRATAAENTALEAQWTKRYTPPPPLPDEWLPAQRALDRLTSLRRAAMRGAEAARSAEKSITQLERREETLRAQYVRVSRELSGLEPSRDPVAYNAKVRENNDCVAQLAVVRDEIEKARRRGSAGQDTVRDYLQALVKFENDYRDRLRNGIARDQEPHVEAWLRAAEDRRTAYRADLSRLHVPVRSEAGSTVVTARLNDRVDAALVVDTGASFVTLSEVLAERMDLDYRRGRRVQLTLADGSLIEGRGIVLRSLAVGEAREEAVDAVIIPEPPGRGVDGLLGMSFLGRFVMSLDGATGDLVLGRFEPE